MAAQERIVGGGFLLIGVVIVLVLVYFFTIGGADGKAAYDAILNDHFPAYEAAVKEGDYIAVKATAKRILETMDDGGAATIRTHVAADATAGEGPAKRLQDCIKADAFAKNADGQFGFRDGWYSDRSHRALNSLDRSLDKFKVLERVRDAATQANAALDLARRGVKDMEIPFPPLKGKIQDDAPVMDPNPIYVHDQELYRVFGLDSDVLKKALATKLDETGTRAWQARRKWNDDVVGSGLNELVTSIPEQADELTRLATDVALAVKALSEDPTATAAVKLLIDDAARRLGVGLTGEAKETYRANVAKFAKGTVVANVLRNEGKMLSGYLPTVRALGATLNVKFQ
ncbi:MAG: hypothetical protein ACYTGN_15425 [Planctomycetota bacterium]|jgi:hypothetical protein